MRVDRPARTSMPRTLALVLSCSVFLAAGQVAAQSISGVVADAGTREPVGGAEITLRGPDGATHGRTGTDEAGQFIIYPPTPGAWTLTVQRIGFETVTSEPLAVHDGEWVEVEISLLAHAIPLEPIVVTTRRSTRSPAIQRFYDRRDQARRGGLGHFIVREDIERISPHRPTDLLRTAPGVRVVRGAVGRGEGVRMASGCIPAIYVDGMQLNRSRRSDSMDDYVTVLDIEGIEVYRGASSQVGSFHDPSGCGLVMVWTRGGLHRPGEPFRWRTVLGALGAIGLFILIVN